MNAAETPLPAAPKGEIALDDVVEIKGYLFKIVLIDGYTGKIAMKCITPEEAQILRTKK